LASRRKEEKTECGEGGINKARTVATVDSRGRTIWIADAHRDDGKRSVVHADEKLTAFLELPSAICAATPWLGALFVLRCGIGFKTTDDVSDESF